jgi:hypothetical protein
MSGLPVAAEPTAQTLCADTAAMPFSSLTETQLYVASSWFVYGALRLDDEVAGDRV